MLGKRIYLQFAQFSITNRAKVGVAGQFQVRPPLNSWLPYVCGSNYMQRRLIPFAIEVDPFCKRGQPQSKMGLRDWTL